MNLTQWYAISLAASAATLLTYYIGTVVSTFLIVRFQYFALKNIVYPLLLRRFWTGTRFQGGLVGIYIILNGFCMGLGIKSSAELLTRSGLMASINLIPLFMGGRTSMLANLLGISLHTYYLAHHWIGRVVIVQSLIHVGLVISSRKPWTIDSIQITGITVSLSLVTILLFNS